MSNATFDNCTCRLGSVVVRFRTVCVCLLRTLRGNQLLLHHFLCMYVLCAVLHLVSMLLLAMPNSMLVYRLQLRLYRLHAGTVLPACNRPGAPSGWIADPGTRACRTFGGKVTLIDVFQTGRGQSECRHSQERNEGSWLRRIGLGGNLGI